MILFVCCFCLNKAVVGPRAHFGQDNHQLELEGFCLKVRPQSGDRCSPKILRGAAIRQEVKAGPNMSFPQIFRPLSEFMFGT